MASQSKGIQQLLQAEKKAADLVSEARKRKYRSRKAVFTILCSCEGNWLLLNGKIVYTKFALSECYQVIPNCSLKYFRAILKTPVLLAQVLIHYESMYSDKVVFQLIVGN